MTYKDMKLYILYEACIHIQHIRVYIHIHTSSIYKYTYIHTLSGKVLSPERARELVDALLGLGEDDHTLVVVVFEVY